jgi:uncharacterized membrane protein
VINFVVSFFVIRKLHGIHCEKVQVEDVVEEVCVQNSISENEKAQEQALWINLVAGGLQVFVLILRYYYPARKAEKTIFFNIVAINLIFWYCIGMIFLPIFGISVTLMNKDETLVSFSWNIAVFFNQIFLLVSSINPIFGLAKVLYTGCFNVIQKISAKPDEDEPQKKEEYSQVFWTDPDEKILL